MFCELFWHTSAFQTGTMNCIWVKKSVQVLQLVCVCVLFLGPCVYSKLLVVEGRVISRTDFEALIYAKLPSLSRAPIKNLSRFDHRR